MANSEESSPLLINQGENNTDPQANFTISHEKSVSDLLLGDDRPCLIKGIGSVSLKLLNGSTIDLNDVRYIPELKRNLISLGTLEKGGCKVSMGNGRIKSHRVKFGRKCMPQKEY
ncbi:hypothetical protein L1987_34870 [Smallanthus sonchifolius]|uniref:Uncharacterized protein n=1 Tax=Smallanthus sonchifolius TaxID=185202 RepID=A0ACB9HWI8_9ASTR|nr:hypothetical protein L1987_34870 [Smallanthus sonchifolius]